MATDKPPVAAFIPANKTAKRLIKPAVVLSVAVSVVFSLIHCGVEYHRNVTSLQTAVDTIESAHQKSMTAALWSFDKPQIASLLEEFGQYPFVSYAAVFSKRSVISEVGVKGKSGVEVRTVPMAAEYNGRMVPVGSLYLEIDRTAVLRRTMVSGALIFVYQTLTGVIMMLAALLLFERQVTRHLAAAARYFGEMDIDHVNTPLVLDKTAVGDELDDLVNAFNRMRASLFVAYKQLTQVKKMEAVGRLAGGVAHDYNNKLTVILGYAELLRRSGAGDREEKDQIREIIRAAEHSRDITRQLLAFSRNQSVAPASTDLNRLVERARNSLIRLIGEDITFRVVAGTGLWPVLIDPTQADQILMNLVLNARDAIAGNGSVTVVTENVVLDNASSAAIPGTVPGEHVLLTVSDTGCGIPPETLEHIFEPFFSTKETGKGTGLGLATVYGIVQQNGGAIQVRSEQGKGSAFSVCLPRFTGEEKEDEPVIVPRTVAPSGSVLVIDDDETICQIAAKMLEHYGFTVQVAQTVEEAFGVCRQAGLTLDLLLVDVILPTMNAGEMIPLIRQHQPAARVLCMSGYPAEIIAQRGMIGEEVPFIQKPFSPETLRKKVTDVLSAPR